MWQELKPQLTYRKNDSFGCEDSLGDAFKGPTGINSGSNTLFQTGLCVLLFNSQTIFPLRSEPDLSNYFKIYGTSTP